MTGQEPQTKLIMLWIFLMCFQIGKIKRVPMPLDVVVSFEDGTSEMYYIPNDLLYLDNQLYGLSTLFIKTRCLK